MIDKMITQIEAEFGAEKIPTLREKLEKWFVVGTDKPYFAILYTRNDWIHCEGAVRQARLDELVTECANTWTDERYDMAIYRKDADSPTGVSEVDFEVKAEVIIE